MRSEQHITVLWAAKGGSGTTVTTAAAAIHEPADVVIVDLQGDMVDVLATPWPNLGLDDWLLGEPASDLDELLVNIDSSTRLLPTRSTIDLDQVAGERVDTLARWMQQTDSFVLIDAGTRRPDDALIEIAGRNLIVTRPCYLALMKGVRSDRRPDGIVLINESSRSLNASSVQRSPDVDFGMHWQRRGSDDAWRVSWNRGSGALYATDGDETIVEDLDTYASEVDVARAFPEWGTHHRDPDGLDWVRRKLELSPTASSVTDWLTPASQWPSVLDSQRGGFEARSRTPSPPPTKRAWRSRSHIRFRPSRQLFGDATADLQPWADWISSTEPTHVSMDLGWARSARDWQWCIEGIGALVEYLGRSAPHLVATGPSTLERLSDLRTAWIGGITFASQSPWSAGQHGRLLLDDLTDTADDRPFDQLIEANAKTFHRVADAIARDLRRDDAADTHERLVRAAS